MSGLPTTRSRSGNRLRSGPALGSSWYGKLLKSCGQHWRGHYRGWVALHFWLAVAAVLWLFLDARFEASLDWWHFQNAAATPGEMLDYHMADWWWLRLRNSVLMVLIGMCGLATVAMVLQFVFGTAIQRGLRAMMGLIMVVAIWLAIGTHWQDIVWQGKQYRLSQILTEFQVATEPLREQWPQQDGDLEGLGQFMAYPVGRPRTLLMLTMPQMKSFPGTFASVEGQPGGPFRFELVDQEEGDWLEWHPAGSYPATFTGGLGDLYRLKKSHALHDGWYLARYDHTDF